MYLFIFKINVKFILVLVYFLNMIINIYFLLVFNVLRINLYFYFFLKGNLWVLIYINLDDVVVFEYINIFK